LDAQGAANTIWAFYESAEVDVRKLHFVGALWGLIDLKDQRAADALADLLWEGCYFYELFGFLSLAGDARAVIPLLLLGTIGGVHNNDIGQHAAMSLLSIAHRIGRDALLTEFQSAGPQTARQQRQREGMADDILTTSPRKAEEYFALFYRGLMPEDIDLAGMAAWRKRFDEQDQLGWSARRPPTTTATASLPARHRPGRNDPCWCGSGKKYKRCHMRQDGG